MLDRVIVRYTILPAAIGGFTIYNAEDDSYNIYINSNHGYYEQQKTLKHELHHIYNGDFDKIDVDVSSLEEKD